LNSDVVKKSWPGIEVAKAVDHKHAAGLSTGIAVQA